MNTIGTESNEYDRYRKGTTREIGLDVEEGIPYEAVLLEMSLLVTNSVGQNLDSRSSPLFGLHLGGITTVQNFSSIGETIAVQSLYGIYYEKTYFCKEKSPEVAHCAL